MQPERLFIMIDPVTETTVDLCSGPDDDGRCSRSAYPPYECAGLLVTGSPATPERDVSFQITDMVPGRCPLAWIDEPLSASLAQ